MQDNSINDEIETLIRYMDGELSDTENEAIEKALQNDVSLQEHYQYLLAAKRAIRSQGIRQRVAGIQRAYIKERVATETAPIKMAKRRSAFTTFMRVAAVFIIALLGYGVFQYTTISTQMVYDDAYTAYQLPLSRSDEKATDIDALYSAGNDEAVIQAFNEKEVKSQKGYFLAAQSYLHVNNAKAAIAAFQQIEKLNKTSNTKYFVQETDYYLMLAYIKAGRIEEAIAKRDKILSDKQHLFYNKAKAISHTKLMLLHWREK